MIPGRRFRLWSAETGAPATPPFPFTADAYAADAAVKRLLLVSDTAGLVQVWERRDLAHHARSERSPSSSADGRRGIRISTELAGQ